MKHLTPEPHVVSGRCYYVIEQYFINMEKEPSLQSPPAPQAVYDWLGNEELPVTIWEKKYRNGDETFEQWLDRVSGGNTDVKRLIREKKFIFAGRILSNRGIKDRKITLSNCYVTDIK